MTVRPGRSVGIVGFGQMGRFMASLLAPGASVLAFDPAPQATKLPDGVRLASVGETAACDIVFLFPPISRFGDCCDQIARHLRPGTIVVEGGSVMCHPVLEMSRRLPPTVDLVGCHPLFGPQSGANGVKGMKIVLSPVRTSHLADVVDLLRPLELEVVVMSPEAHDQVMARTQALEQLVARTLMRLDIAAEPIDLPGYRKLLELKHMLEQDSDDLFRSIQRHNPFAATIRRDLRAALDEVSAGLDDDAQEPAR